MLDAHKPIVAVDLDAEEARSRSRGSSAGSGVSSRNLDLRRRMGRLTVVFIGLFAALGLIGAGCGDSSSSSRLSKAEYQAKLDEVGKLLEKGLNPDDWIPSGTTSQTSAEIAALGQRVHSVIVHAATEVESLRPPKEAETFNERFVAFLRFAADAEPKLAMALARSDNAKVVSVGGEIEKSPELKGFMSASRDLQRKGYHLGDVTGADQAQSSVTPAKQIPTKSGGGSTSSKQDVKAKPFALTSAAGKQEAVHLTTAVETCTGNSCSLESFPLQPPVQMSVIRPGETVRFVPGLPIRPESNGLPSVSYAVSKACGGLLFRRGNLGFFRKNNTWAVQLPPGDYAVQIGFGWQQGSRQIEESGTVGLRVSRDRPRTIVRAPKC